MPQHTSGRRTASMLQGRVSDSAESSQGGRRPDPIGPVALLDQGYHDEQSRMMTDFFDLRIDARHDYRRGWSGL